MQNKVRIAVTTLATIAVGYLSFRTAIWNDLVWLLAAYFSHRLHCHSLYIAIALLEWAIGYALLGKLLWKISGRVQKHFS